MSEMYVNCVSTRYIQHFQPHLNIFQFTEEGFDLSRSQVHHCRYYNFERPIYNFHLHLTPECIFLDGKIFSMYRQCI
jgi:hypothetical protein